MNGFTSGSSAVEEAQSSIHRWNLGISGQAVEVVWTAHPGFDSIQSWQPAFVLASEWKGSRAAFRLAAPSQVWGKAGIQFLSSVSQRPGENSEWNISMGKKSEARDKLWGHGMCSLKEGQKGEITVSVNTRSHHKGVWGESFPSIRNSRAGNEMPKCAPGIV